MTTVSTPAQPAEISLTEFTLKVFVLSILLTLVLAAANAYLALKIGILTSASIPAAILSMGILRFFSRTSILEHNLVQTSASAGQAIAGGVVYTMPALIIIGYWSQFNYWTNALVALLGGMLGVLFSIPLRRVLVNLPQLPFPEGRAIAQVLKAGDEEHTGLGGILWGGAIGAGLEALQMGFKVFANQAQVWVAKAGTVVGFGIGFSPAMIGAGYIIGPRITISIFIGAVLSWLIGVPIAASMTGMQFSDANLAGQVGGLWSNTLRYVAIGGMLMAALLTLAQIVKPIFQSLHISMQAFKYRVKYAQQVMPRTEQDVPMLFVLLGVLCVLVLLGIFFAFELPLIKAHFITQPSIFIITCLAYILVLGFVLSALTGYFSGLVGVAATPGSAVVIAALLFAALMIRTFLAATLPVMTSEILMLGAAVTIFLGAVITGAAALAVDTVQDLKVGQLVGATPWRQQVMLMLGVVCSALIIPPVMNLLFNVYGIAGVMPHAGMDPSLSLPAPPAALMAAVSQGVFNYAMPWHLLGIGAVLVLGLHGLHFVLARRDLNFSVLAISVGMYLPLESSIPLAIGGLFAWLVARRLHSQTLTTPVAEQRARKGMIIACGLVAGAALMEVVLAIPFVLLSGPDSLRIMPNDWQSVAVVFSVLGTLGIGRWLFKIVSFHHE